MGGGLCEEVWRGSRVRGPTESGQETGCANRVIAGESLALASRAILHAWHTVEVCGACENIRIAAGQFGYPMVKWAWSSGRKSGRKRI